MTNESAPDKTIDLARPGLSKSLMTNPCSRKGAYSELIRDDSGRRLRFPMPERVTFGRAIDAAHAYIAEQERDGRRWTVSVAYDLAVAAAEADEESWALIEDQSTFRVQVSNALHLFPEQAEGLPKLRERISQRLRIQGDNGRSLTVEDVVGTPDYFDDLGPIDVKTTGRTYTASKFWQSPEMPVYAWLWSAENGGAIPPVLAYQVYVRLVKPKWQWIEVPGTAAHVELGRAHAKRWRKGLALGDVDLFDANLSFCGDCPFAQPIPEFGHEGCEFGMLMPQGEEEAA